ncbi:hypothetical protein LTR94_036913, partial [Friedmanniomyces endolithicus]
SRSTTAPRARAWTTTPRARPCCLRNNRRANSSPRKNWARWPCSSAARQPTRCAAWPGTWMEAGLR